MGIDPVTMAIVGGIASAGATAVSTMAGMQASSYQAAVAKRNSKLAEENAARAMESSQVQGQDAGESAGQQIAALIASRGTSGTLLGTGSNAQVVEGQRSLARRDQRRIREEGMAESGGYKQQAADFRAERRQAQTRRKFQLASGVIGLGGDFVGGSKAVAKARL